MALMNFLKCSRVFQTADKARRLAAYVALAELPDKKEHDIALSLERDTKP